MLKTLGNTESTTKPKKARVGVDGNSNDDCDYVDGDSCNDNSDKNFSDAPKLICPPTPPISKLKMSASTDLSATMPQIMVEFDGVDSDNNRNGNFNKKVPFLRV